MIFDLPPLSTFVVPLGQLVVQFELEWIFHNYFTMLIWVGIFVWLTKIKHYLDLLKKTFVNSSVFIQFKQINFNDILLSLSLKFVIIKKLKPNYNTEKLKPNYNTVWRNMIAEHRGFNAESMFKFKFSKKKKKR